MKHRLYSRYYYILDNKNYTEMIHKNIKSLFISFDLLIFKIIEGVTYVYGMIHFDSWTNCESKYNYLDLLCLACNSIITIKYYVIHDLYNIYSI